MSNVFQPDLDVRVPGEKGGCQEQRCENEDWRDKAVDAAPIDIGVVKDTGEDALKVFGERCLCRCSLTSPILSLGIVYRPSRGGRL